LSQDELDFDFTGDSAGDLSPVSPGEGIFLYGSNDPDVLVHQCATNLAKPLGDPFLEEEFLVQSRGMETWVSMRLADKMGVFAQARFRFPEETIWMILRGFLGHGPSRNPYTKEAMAWKIFEILPGLMEEHAGAFSPILAYLGREENNLDRRFRLCRQISTVFDSYQTYRPEMIIRWMRGKEAEGQNIWQSLTWRKLHKEFGEQSLPERVLDMQNLQKPKDFEILPERLSVFGISTLPPIFLDILEAYGRFRDLHIYALQPAPVMWGEVESEKCKQRALLRASQITKTGWSEESLHVESGNPLIGSFGRTGRDFFNLLVDRDANDQPLDFRKPEGNSLLASLQRWTFEVFSDRPKNRMLYDPDDLSICITSCHGPMREAEALRDYLLHLFAEDSTLNPQDIVVMMPDPELYAPYIRATFGQMEEGMPGHFPFSIIDREPRKESQLVDFFFDLLEFFEGGATNQEVLDLLDSLPMRMKFELSDEDLETIRKWMRECHLHWGLDGVHREFLGSINTEEHTWKHALDRMALGFCMRGKGDRLWDDCLPYDEIEGGNAQLFAKLYQLVEHLQRFHSRARIPRKLIDWAKFLESLTAALFPQSNETLLDRRRINEAIRQLSLDYSPLAPNAIVPLRVITHHLGNVIESGTPQGQFLTKGVTFCGLRPMRSVSARVICMIGMNEGSFPRPNRTSSFDLSGDRRAGDRSAREDDRYLFLESIWCAKDRFYLSYVGQSIRQNQPIPPSVVLNEFLDALDKVADFGEKDGNRLSARDALIRVQSLHPFSEKNFLGQGRFRSYSADHCQAARSLSNRLEDVPPFAGASVELGAEKQDCIRCTDLVRFFDSPAKYFLTHALGMNLWEENAPPDDFEPTVLGNLEKYGVKSSLLEIHLKRQPQSDLYWIEKARGSLPPGSLGKVGFNDAAREVDQFIERWGDALTVEYNHPCPFEVSVDDFVLQGEWDTIANNHQIFYRCGKTRPKDRISAWIHHLVACASGQFADLETRFFAMDKAKKYLCYGPVEPEWAKQCLSELVDLFRSGMQRPIPFFPSTSFAYQMEIHKSENPADETVVSSATNNARKEWSSTEFSYGGGPKESESPENQLCFYEEPMGDPEFVRLAQLILDPIFKHAREEKTL
jgi:exodeoxyribonuclease V gamma subunit